jgi:hypothetical protein
LEGHLDDIDVVVRGSEVEHREDILPSRPDVGGSGAHHLGHTTNNHVTNGHRSGERGRGRERERERKRARYM